MAAKKKKPVAKGKRRKGTPPSSTGKVQNVVADQSTWRKKLQQSRLKFDDPQKDIYLTALADHGMKGRAAAAAGVSMQTVNDHAENDPDFAVGRDQALEAYRDKFVDHATNLAYDGILVKKYNKEGALIEERKDYPIRLIELELKRVEPGYRDKQTIDLNTTGGGVLVAPAGKTPAQWIEDAAESNKTAKSPMERREAEEKEKEKEPAPKAT